MAHIVIDARIINSSTGRYVERLLTYLSQIDHKNSYTVLVPTKDKDYWRPNSSSQDNFQIKTVDFANYSFAEQLNFNFYLQKLKPDLVHFCMPQQPLLYRGKTVTTFHDLTLLNTYNSDKGWIKYHLKQAVGRLAFKKILAKNNAIITPCKFTKTELQTFTNIAENKIKVIYESAEPSINNPLKYSSAFKKYLLYVGQQSDYKNIKRLGDAHQLLLAKYPDLGLILVGKKNASTQTNENYFTNRQYKNIVFAGFVPDNQLSWLYSHAEAYVFPSLMEGFGLPGLEAMAHNTAVISSNATCLPEVYGKAARYFNPTDSSDIAQKIDEVLSSPALRQTLINNGRTQLKKYSWKKMAQETLAVYENVLKS